ncbi:hypothetical protein V6N13_081346 [Hibiscus sabdariffa]
MVYDIEHTMKFYNSIHGGSSKLAKLLDVERVVFAALDLVVNLRGKSSQGPYRLGMHRVMHTLYNIERPARHSANPSMLISKHSQQRFTVSKCITLYKQRCSGSDKFVESKHAYKEMLARTSIGACILRVLSIRGNLQRLWIKIVVSRFTFIL